MGVGLRAGAGGAIRRRNLAALGGAIAGVLGTRRISAPFSVVSRVLIGLVWLASVGRSICQSFCGRFRAIPGDSGRFRSVLFGEIFSGVIFGDILRLVSVDSDRFSPDFESLCGRFLIDVDSFGSTVVQSSSFRLVLRLIS